MKVAFPIVGVGASAGGLEAFSQLLQRLDTTTGMAFVLIQHLDPKRESLLSEILGKSTHMPVTEVSDGVKIAPDHIFIIPPNTRMMIVADQLKLCPRDTEYGHYPIDDFFFSLASEYKDKAVGVVLSGTGSDGAKGLAAIMAEGGVTFAQEPASAKFDKMPAAAIASGVDFVMSPEGIADELAILASNKLTLESSTDQESRSPTKEAPNSLKRIFALLRAARGLDFSHYKQPTVQRRISKRMAIQKMQKIEDYAAFLRTHPTEVDNLYEDILIKVTCFFRNPESFAALKELVFPALFKERTPGIPIRIWVPGCASGEEAYSIAICLLEFMDEAYPDTKIEIFATDISERALAKARLGKYDANIVEHVSKERLKRFFVKEGTSYRIVSEIRDCCLFAKQNVARDPPFSKLDLISCRNVLIYLTPGIQKRILSTFHFALNPDGFLILSNAETIGADTDLFGVVDKTCKIFSRKPALHGMFVPEFSMGSQERMPASLPASSWGETGKKPDLKGDAERVILAKYVSPGVIINERMDILQFRGDTTPYLRHPPGEATNNLFKMCRSGLLVDLRMGLHEASVSNELVKKDGWIKNSGEKATPVTINLIPFTASVTAQRYFIVLFAPRAISTSQSASEETKDNNAYQRLERELAETKEYLNAIIEKEQATNEELKSASEEILSANEELQSSNEEMSTAKEETQATNEELVTVNEELQNRNEEVIRINSDLSNLFGSVQIPIVMLAGNLSIRHYTPAAEKVLNLSPADIGRLLPEISSKLHVDGLDKLAAEVIESLNTKDQEVQDRSGCWYSMRVKPYRTIDNKIEGAVIALVDINALKLSFHEVAVAYNYADAIVQTAPVPLLVLDENLCVMTANQAFLKHFQVTKTETEKQKIYEIGNGQWNVPKMRELLEKILPKNDLMENFIIDHNFPKLGRRVIRLSGRRLAQQTKMEPRILLAIQDVSEEKHSEELSRAAKDFAETASQAKSDFLANMSHEIRTPLGAILGYSELLANPNQTSSETLHSATRIRKNVEQLTELIDEILDIAKIEAGKLDIERRRFELLPELAETLASLQVRAESKNLSFDVNFATDIPGFITSCPKRLRQIILNIVGNALKFTEHGGVSICIQFLPASEKTGPAQLCIIVTDTGCGLNVEQQSRLFKPFSQADSSVTRRFGGTGLGLVLARRLAEALGGDVILTKSRVGVGSTFTISIDPGPLDEVSLLKDLTKEDLEKHEEVVSNWFRPSERLAGIRVLLVEDGPDNQALMTSFLEASGANVETAINGAKAIELAEANHHDIVLMDIQMPVLDGYEATKRLRAKGFKTPIIALTAHVMQGEREKCLAAGCVDYISKPVKPYVLIDIVERAVKKKILAPDNMSGRSLLADDPIVGPLVAQFVGNLPKRLAAIIRAQEHSDYHEVESQAHQMAGAAGGYGFPKMGRIAAKIEAQAREHVSPDILAKSIAGFRSLCDAAVRGNPRLH